MQVPGARGGRLPVVLALVGFVVAISLFLGLGIHRGETLLVGDSLYYIDPTFAAVGGGVFETRPANFAMDIDNSLHNYPFRAYARASFERGEVPWWNPYVAMGLPFVGLGSGVFDPVAALAGWLLPAESFTNLIAVLGLWIAAAGMLLFLGSLGLSLPARIFGAVAFTFSGWTIVFLGRQNFMAEIWLPWLFWATARLLERRDVLRIGVLALLTGLVCLTGHLQTAVHVLTAVAIFAVALLIGSSERVGDRARAVGWLGAGVALGVGVALIQIVPLLEMIGQQPSLEGGRNLFVEGDGFLAALWFGLRGNFAVMSAMLPTAVTSVAPQLFGAPQDDTYWWLPGFAHYSGATIYVGLVPLFFALYALVRWRSTPGVGFWLFLALASLGVAYALPVFNLVNYLPGFDVIDNGRFRGIYRFAISVAAAIGLVRFIASEPRPRLLLAALYAGGVLLLPLVVFLILPTTPFGESAFAELGSVPLWEVALAGEVPVLIVLALAGVALIAWRQGWIGRLPFATAMIAIAFGDSYLVLHDFNPRVPSSFVFPTTPAVAFLKQDPSLFRVSSSLLGTILPANTKLPYALYDVDLYSVLALERYVALQTALSPVPTDAYRNFTFENPAKQRGLLDLMNVKYVVLPASLPPEDDPFHGLDSYRRVYEQEVVIYQNLQVLPRAFLIGRSRLVRKPEQVVAALRRPGFDPRKAVLLEDPSSPALSSPRGESVDGEAEVVALESNRIVVRTRTSDPAYLVLSEANAPGWTATVDGAETPIHTAYFLFRAVHLEPGEHEIVFHFMPPAYRTATIVSLACLAAIVGLMGLGSVPRR